jgi:hypothetical protein
MKGEVKMRFEMTLVAYLDAFLDFEQGSTSGYLIDKLKLSYTKTPNPCTTDILQFTNLPMLNTDHNILDQIDPLKTKFIA